MKEYYIMGGFEGKMERIALKCKTKQEAVTRLNSAFGKAKSNLWVDSLGQEFSIIEKEVYEKSKLYELMADMI